MSATIFMRSFDPEIENVKDVLSRFELIALSMKLNDDDAHEVICFQYFLGRVANNWYISFKTTTTTFDQLKRAFIKAFTKNPAVQDILCEIVK